MKHSVRINLETLGFGFGTCPLNYPQLKGTGLGSQTCEGLLCCVQSRNRESAAAEWDFCASDRELHPEQLPNLRVFTHPRAAWRDHSENYKWDFVGPYL